MSDVLELICNVLHRGYHIKNIYLIRAVTSSGKKLRSAYQIHKGCFLPAKKNLRNDVLWNWHLEYWALWRTCEAFQFGCAGRWFQISRAMQRMFCENSGSKKARQLKTNTMKSLFHVWNLGAWIDRKYHHGKKISSLETLRYHYEFLTNFKHGPWWPSCGPSHSHLGAFSTRKGPFSS